MLVNCRSKWLRRYVGNGGTIDGSGMVTVGHVFNKDKLGKYTPTRSAESRTSVLQKQKEQETTLQHHELDKGKHNNRSIGIKSLGQYANTLFMKYFPITMKKIIDIEATNKEYSFEGSFNMAKSLDISVNLHNPGHYDLRDMGYAIAIWLRMCPERPDPDDWFFLLPNASIVLPNGKESHGVAIKLYHGTMISWNGTEVKHCTMYHPQPTNKDDRISLFVAPKQKYGIKEGERTVLNDAPKV